MTADTDPHAKLVADHEALMQFLYLAPVGLVQTAADGEILLINPISAQLLMPLQRDGNLVNLFDALADVAPDLRHLCATFGRPSGMVCDGVHIQLGSVGTGGLANRRAPQVLSLSLLKLDATRMMAVLADVTEQVRRERQLRQNDAWLNALLTSITDYALVGLDRQGRVNAWNETIGRVTGHGDGIVGQPYAVFHPPGATTPEQAADRLRDADQNGWSLDEGPRVRADGSEFWASAMISPLPDRDTLLAGTDAPAYCLVLRDVGDRREAFEARRRSLFCDHLTGVANRRAFFHAAARELSRSRRAPRPTALISSAGRRPPHPPRPRDTPMMDTHKSDAYEALVQFLYRAPIGLVQASLDGTVDMLNPMSSSLLMPLARDGSLDNLFTVLQDVAPQLRSLVEAFDQPSGVVCEGLRVQLGAPQVLSLSVLKLDAARLMATVTDATAEVQREQQRLARRLKSQAHTDALTRMPNREAVLDQLRRMLARPAAGEDGVDGPGFALLFMNCDRFRQINDALGQAAGDRLLVQIGERIRATLRPPTDHIDPAAGTGQMAARTGADEFAVVLGGLRRREDAERVATRLLDALARPHTLDGQEVTCRLSMGLVWTGGAGAGAGEMLRDASIAMVEAKRTGGARCVVFEQTMRERAARRADIESDLRQALVDDQLFVVYQPVVGLTVDGGTDRAAGVEALVRWRHPVRGVVPPFEFIQVAEESGLICALGDFVLRRACRDFAAWQRALGERAPRLLAVNLSRAQLGEPGWPDVVREVLAQNGMRPAQLQLEVTESLAAQDQQVQQRLHELKAIGVTLALDDFGTGYSSLSSLHQLPVDTVKIDRSFVCQADTSHHHRVLIEATVKVAQSLGMSTVAEGIETEAQAAAVRAQACAKGQGYLFSRPLTSGDLLDWLAADRT